MRQLSVRSLLGSEMESYRNTDEKTELKALDFAQFLYPDGVDGAKCRMGWCIDHWGTKWNACFVAALKIVIQRAVNLVKNNFDTAWSPMSTELIVAMKKQFPRKTFIMNLVSLDVDFMALLMMMERYSLIAIWRMMTSGQPSISYLRLVITNTMTSTIREEQRV